jgi:hypothetical protein
MITGTTRPMHPLFSLWARLICQTSERISASLQSGMAVARSFVLGAPTPQRFLRTGILDPSSSANISATTCFSTTTPLKASNLSSVLLKNMALMPLNKDAGHSQVQDVPRQLAPCLPACSACRFCAGSSCFLARCRGRVRPWKHIHMVYMQKTLSVPMRRMESGDRPRPTIIPKELSNYPRTYIRSKNAMTGIYVHSYRCNRYSQYALTCRWPLKQERECPDAEHHVLKISEPIELEVFL